MGSVLKELANKAVVVTVEGEEYTLAMPPHEVRNEVMALSSTLIRNPDDPPPEQEDIFNMFDAICGICSKSCAATVRESDMEALDWERLASLVFNPDPESEYPSGLDDLFYEALKLCGLRDFIKTIKAFKDMVQKQGLKDGEEVPGAEVQDNIGTTDAGLGK